MRDAADANHEAGHREAQPDRDRGVTRNDDIAEPEIDDEIVRRNEPASTARKTPTTMRNAGPVIDRVPAVRRKRRPLGVGQRRSEHPHRNGERHDQPKQRFGRPPRPPDRPGAMNARIPAAMKICDVRVFRRITGAAANSSAAKIGGTTPAATGGR